jgi:site-specific DNA-methyltransferase (adenine-specific)
MNTEDFKNKIIQGDCLEKMKDIPDKSIDMILCVICHLHNSV